MRDFRIKNYSSFTDAFNNISNSENLLLQHLNNIKISLKNLNTDDVFSGTIADSVMDGWNNVVAAPYEQSIQELSKAGDALINFKNSYITADNNNSKQIGGSLNG